MLVEAMFLINVIERLNHFMTSTKVQPYAEFDTSAIAGDNMDQATNLFAEMINAENDEIIIGGFYNYEYVCSL